MRLQLPSAERLPEIAAKNKGKLVSGLIVVVALTAAGGYWLNLQQQTKLEASRAMSEIIENLQIGSELALDEEQTQKLIHDAEHLIQNYSNSVYSLYAAVARALFLAQQGNKDEAIASLTELMGTVDMKSHQGTFIGVQLSRLHSSERQYERSLELLGQLNHEAYNTIVSELEGDAHFALGQYDDAAVAYKSSMDAADPEDPYNLILSAKYNRVVAHH